MKHGKRPTKAQKTLLTKYNLEPNDWLIVKDCRECFSIVHKISKVQKIFARGGVSEEA